LSFEVTESDNDARVVASWHANAPAWTRAVRAREIESRRLVTDAAIVAAVMRLEPTTALDLGCGEGWLTRALAERGVRTTGVDAVPALIEQARAAGGGDFAVVSYDDLAEGRVVTTTFDVVVANFSLIGGESVRRLLRRVPDWLEPRGAFIVQALHPVVACGDLEYSDGWRDGSWAGFSSDFTDPAPWYFRTVASWVRLLHDSALRVDRLEEPIHPITGKPASLIITAQPGG
jgi:2-polyprenyl-3-methyl-5-hydroxy-6-metoxy-1,4-benzoquinol methylase